MTRYTSADGIKEDSVVTKLAPSISQYVGSGPQYLRF